MTQVSDATAGERAALLELARELATRELAPQAALLDAGDPLVIGTCWRRLAEVGLNRALVLGEPEDAGLDPSDLLAAVEELATGDAGVAMSVVLSNAALAALGPERAAELDGSERWVLVPVKPETEVTISAKSLDGRVEAALGAYDVDGLVLAVSGPQPAVFEVAAGTKGLVLDRDEAQMGLRGAPAASITLTDVSADSPGPTPEPALALLWAGTAAVGRGIARRAYEMALDYAKARRQGDRAIIGHDAVSDMLGAMAVELAWPLPPVAGVAEALAAKIAAADASVAIAKDAVQVFGGVGYMCETGIEKLMRDAKYCQLFPEPSWIARDELMRLKHAAGREPVAFRSAG